MQVTIHHTSAANGFRPVGRASTEEVALTSANLRIGGSSPVAESTFEYAFTDATEALNATSRATNSYGEVEREVWAAIRPNLNPLRATTAITVGDQITVAGCRYNVESQGFSLTQQATR